MMKHLFTMMVAGLTAFSYTESFAGDNYWKKFDGKTAPSRQPMNVAPKDYRIFTLDQNAMRNFLFNLSTDYNEAQQIFLPTPDQKFRSFHIWKTPMMESELAGRYPEIQTFTAEADDDHGVTAKIDYTLFGFSALVFDGTHSYMVDPYSNDPDGYYIAFYKSDFYPSNVASGICGVKSNELAPPDQSSPTSINTGGNTAARVNGSLKHTYRLALSCTGEYAVNAVGANPTKPQVLSKLVTTMNRVNGFYERELSVSMNLINNEDAIIYTSPANDPYTCNLNLSCLINEVQTNITATIGPQNYDIGHIVCTAGGGLAQLTAVCGGGKARGTSTSGGPDDFSVILHEMGHQYGSNHTFSANTGGCNGNGNESTAYEPGGGISIMSYAGLCDPNNVGNWENYFHVSSLNEINTYLTGPGSGCGVTNAGSTPVSLPQLVDSFDIPQNTPFELTAPLATAAQTTESIRYAWEQYDLGNFGQTEAQNGNATSGPLMRAYYPDTLRIRSYPEAARIIDGSYTAPGQRLPKTARTVRFKLTARSVYQGWGTFQFIDSVVRLKVAGSANNFRVTSQANPETWNPGETKNITWAIGGTNTAPVNCGWVNVYLSLDDGNSFPFLLVANAPNTGSYTVTIPNVSTTKGRIKVKGTGNVFYDINKGAITINGNPNGIQGIQLAEELAIYPNPATDKVYILSKNQGLNLTAAMYNAVGQKVWDGKIKGNTEVSVNGLARGNYMIQVVDAGSGARKTYKIVLQ